jgi:hypothetical protein
MRNKKPMDWAKHVADALRADFMWELNATDLSSMSELDRTLVEIHLLSFADLAEELSAAVGRLQRKTNKVRARLHPLTKRLA